MKIRKGFSLIELVVVILILGILAAVAAPKLFNTSATATDNGLKQTLYVVRDAIELYAADNGGLKPGQSNDLPGDLQQYLRGSFPKCPVALEDATVGYSTGAVGFDSGISTSWLYFTDSGAFIVNSNTPTASDGTVNYDQL